MKTANSLALFFIAIFGVISFKDSTAYVFYDSVTDFELSANIGKTTSDYRTVCSDSVDYQYTATVSWVDKNAGEATNIPFKLDTTTYPFKRHRDWTTYYNDKPECHHFIVTFTPANGIRICKSLKFYIKNDDIQGFSGQKTVSVCGTGIVTENLKTQDWTTNSWALDWRPDGHEQVITGDFNGDGIKDVAHSRSRWGAWRVSLSTGSGFNTQDWSTSPYWSIDLRPDGHEEIVTGDFNGDGKTDIAHSRSRWGDWRVSLSTGSGFNTQNWSTSPYWTIDWRPDGHEQIVTGDFNGDGKTDIAHSRSRWGDWRVSLSTGSGFNTQNWSTSPYWTIDSRPDGHEEIVTGDFNGDGKTDIAHSRSKWGAWRVSLSTGSGFNTQDWSTGSWAIDLRADGHEKIVVADFNGDKKSDIAHTRSQWGYWKVSLSQNNSFVTQEWYTNPFWAVDWLIDNHEEVIVGDFTGDGLADFAHARSRWGGWRISVNK
jgi:hypothetical protein